MLTNGLPTDARFFLAEDEKEQQADVERAQSPLGEWLRVHDEASQNEETGEDDEG